MPIHKRDRNFQNIVSELDIKSIPTEFIQSLSLICENGDRIQFKGEQIKERKFRNMQPYPPNKIPNPKATNADGTINQDEPSEIEDPTAKYDMNEIFALINCTTSNLRELAEDIGSFDDKIATAKERESRGFSVGNLIMNLESQKQKLTLEFESYIARLSQFLNQNKNFSDRCLNRIKLISNEITTSEETAEEANNVVDPNDPAQA